MVRVPYIDRENLSEEHQDLVMSSLQSDKALNVYQAVGNNIEVLSGLRTFLDTLWNDTGLDAYHRELIILTVARELDSAYEWHQHVSIARNEGVSNEEIVALSKRDFDAFDATDKTLLQYTVAVVQNRVTGEIHNAMLDQHDHRTIVGTATLVSGYIMIARLLGALEVNTENEFIGWMVENK